MKFGIHLMAQDLPEYVETVVRAEEAGFDFAWTIDSQLLWQDPSIYMSRGLSATERIAMGVAVTTPETRHVTGIASAYATLDELHPGRVIIGVGRGDSSVRAMGMRPAPTRRLAAAVPVLRELTRGRSVELNGTEVRIAWRREGTSIPIMMGATGPRNLRLAGALADRAMLQVGIHPQAVAWGVEHVRAGASAAGRDPEDVAISVLCACHLAEDREQAREACKWAAASAANHLADVARNVPDHDMPEALEAVIRDREEFSRTNEYDYTKHLDTSAQNLAYLTPEHVDNFAFTGSPEDCLRDINVLRELGVDEISIAYWNGQFDQIGRFSAHVMSAVRDASA